MLERTKLFDAFEKAYIRDWREEIEEEIKDDDYYSIDEITETLKTLGLEEKTIKIIIARIENRVEYIHLNIENNLVNLCVEIGMKLGVDEYLRDNP